jgi:phage-related protein (TIGR01555 family)
MAEQQDQPREQARTGNAGSFRKGQSGNPKGRPRRDAVDTTASRPRRDGWINTSSGHGTSRDRRTLTRYGVDIVTDLEAIQLWRSEFLAARIIEALPEEAFRRSWTLKVEDKELAEQICTLAEDLDVDGAMVDAAQKERAYGGAAIFPVLSGALDDVSQQLDEGAIASVDALHVFEPQELTPHTYYRDFRHKKFGKPETWRLTPLVSGRTGSLGVQIIHETRLVIFPGIRVSRQTQPGQREGWGDSVLCRPNAVLKDDGLAWGSAATLLHEHGMGVYGIDGLAEGMATDDGVAAFDRYMEAIDMASSTLRAKVIDGKDTYTRSTGTLAGLAETLAQFSQRMAAATDGMPVTVLMGMSPAGMNATGESDMRSWYATVEKRRKARYLTRLQRIVKLLLLSTAGPTSGKEPEVWGCEFPPLWTPSEREVAETRKTDMERAKIAIEAGVASADDVAHSFYGGDTYSPEIVIDWAARAKQKKLDEERAEMLDAQALEAMGREESEDPDEPDEPDDQPAPRSTRRDGFNPGQPRDRIGRFAGTEGRVGKAESEQRDYLKSTGKSAEESEAGARAVAGEERSAIENEKQALKAGHVKEPPSEKLDQLEDAQRRTGKELDEHREKLDKAQEDALDELDKLNDFDTEVEDIDIDIREDFERGSNALRHGDRPERTYAEKDRAPRDELDDEEPVAPDPADYRAPRDASAEVRAAHEKDYDEAKARYERDAAIYASAIEARHVAFREQALAAQVKLEQAHEAQLAAREKRREVDKELERAERGAHKELDDLEPGDLVDKSLRENKDGGWDSPELQQSYERAVDAAYSMIEHQRTQIPDLDDDGGADDLKEAARRTAAVISKLSKVTGRKYSRKK